MRTRLQKLRDSRREAERLRDAMRPTLPTGVYWLRDVWSPEAQEAGAEASAEKRRMLKQWYTKLGRKTLAGTAPKHGGHGRQGTKAIAGALGYTNLGGYDAWSPEAQRAGAEASAEARRARAGVTTNEQEAYLNQNGMRTYRGNERGVTHEVLNERGQSIAKVNLQGASRQPHEWSPNEIAEFRNGFMGAENPVGRDIAAARKSTGYRGEGTGTAEYAARPVRATARPYSVSNPEIRARYFPSAASH